MTKNKVKSAINNSIAEILQLLNLSVNEQTISGVITKYLIPLFEFDEITVDPEYNRHLGTVKTMSLKEYVEKHRNNIYERKFFDCACRYCKKIKSDREYKDTKRSKKPDIVIHKRNSDDKNNVIIEIKKNKKCLWDYFKLRYMTSPNGMYRYKLGVFIYFPHNKPKYTWFINGLEKKL